MSARLEVEEAGCVFIGKNKSRPVLGGLFDTLERNLMVSLSVRKPPGGGGKQNDDRNNKGGEDVERQLKAVGHSMRETA